MLGLTNTKWTGRPPRQEKWKGTTGTEEYWKPCTSTNVQQHARFQLGLGSDNHSFLLSLLSKPACSWHISKHIYHLILPLNLSHSQFPILPPFNMIHVILFFNFFHLYMYVYLPSYSEAMFAASLSFLVNPIETPPRERFLTQYLYSYACKCHMVMYTYIW